MPDTPPMPTGPARHREHDAVAAEIRSWYTTSSPEIGMFVARRDFGYEAEPEGPVGHRVVLELDDPADVPAALTAIATRGDDVDIWIDDRDRDRRLHRVLVEAGCQPGTATTVLTLPGALVAAAGPSGLVVIDVGADEVESWSRVKLQGFGDTEAEPEPSDLQAEVDTRRREAPIARYQLAVLDDEPVAILGHYVGTDQMVFLLATRVPWRHQGIAQALLDRWVTRGRAERCRSLSINADDAGRPAELYRRMGFVDEVYWHRRYGLAARP